MARTEGSVQAACGRLGSVFTGLAGVLAVAALIASLPEPDDGARAGPRDRERPGNAVTLTVPDGDLSSTLTIIDASGRELALLTRWYDGEIAGVVPRDDGVGICFWLNLKGDAWVEWTGTAKRTKVRMNADGTMGTFVRRRVGIPAGPEPGPGTP